MEEESHDNRSPAGSGLSTFFLCLPQGLVLSWASLEVEFFHQLRGLICDSTLDILRSYFSNCPAEISSTP